ncbi:MAG: hypothetical protein AB1631_21535 [Acidobacteriota bacterium]
MIASLGTVAVLAHIIIVLLHGVAHTRLGIELSVWQKSYAAIVIVAAPLVAAVLLWTRHVGLGLFLLAASMAGSLIFGGYYHYVAVSPDHVSHLPPGDAQSLFQMTAILLVATEAVGLAVGLFGLQRLRAKAS